MKLTSLIGFFLLFTCAADSSLLDPVIQNVRHIKATHPPGKVPGVWKKKMLWKPRWVKEWKSSNVLKPIWKKFWGPVIIREWVPIPKPPPQWDGAGHSAPVAPHSTPSEATFLDVGEPPSPNLSYLQKSPPTNSYLPPKPVHQSQGLLGAGHTSYHVPQLPITAGYKTQAETYIGQSSYGISGDNGAYDLNPPVDQFNPDYIYGPPTGNHASPPSPVPLLPVKPSVTQSHIHQHAPPHQHHRYHHHHHHHHQHNLKSNPSPDLSKFPPDWNSWGSTQPKTPSHSSGLAQASSALSIVSQVQSTTPRPHQPIDYHLSQSLFPDNEFIQQAALVSEYHYTENPIQSSTTLSVNPSLIPYVSLPISSHGPNQTQSHAQAPVHGFNEIPSPRPISHTPPRQPIPSVHLVATNRPVPPAIRGPPSSEPIHPVHHRPTPAPSHKPKFSSSHVPHANPPKTQTAASSSGPKPSTSVSVHSQAPHRPAFVQMHSPHPTHSHNTPSGTVHPHTKAQIPLNKPNPVHPRAPVHAPSGPPPRHPNSLSSKPPVSKPDTKPKDRVKQDKVKVPDFKALPSTSVQAFHFIEGFPSNETLTRAALIGNINHTRLEENQVEIIAAKPHQKEIPPYVAKLAQAIVSEHLKKAEKSNSTPTTTERQPQTQATTERQRLTQATTEAPTERPSVTIVYPSTNAFVRKTLKDYLEEENNSEKSTKVFVVTPVPQEKVESSREVSAGV